MEAAVSRIDGLLPDTDYTLRIHCMDPFAGEPEFTAWDMVRNATLPRRRRTKTATKDRSAVKAARKQRRNRKG